MFLIEYSDGQYVDGERISWIDVYNSEVRFTLSCDSKCIYDVDPENADLFLNHLSALNDNLTSIQGRYNALKPK